ncbi:undecaprenyl-diphosphate phosphatase [Planctomycetota bacterium]
MTWWQSVVLGIVEGLTEYLPVSSTAHLLLAQRAMGIPESEASNAYAICIQAGAIVAVLGIYFSQVKNMIAGVLGKVRIGDGNEEGFRLARNIVVAFLPAAVIGVLFNSKIEELLFGLGPVVAAWFVGGLAILIVTQIRRSKSESNTGSSLALLTWKAALTIGFIQCIAMWPGTSRSLVTIVGGIIVGLSLTAAVEFSFLLGVVTLLAATVYESLDSGPVMIAAYSPFAILIGCLAAWISAVLAVKWMLAYLKKRDMAIFGYYRVILAIVVGVMLYRGILVG